MLYKNLNRKAQGLSLNIIIMAVIALLVLIVIVFIFTGKTRTFTKGVASCESKGGVCVASESACSGPVLGYAPDDVSCDANKDNPPNSAGDNKICCLQFVES